MGDTVKAGASGVAAWRRAAALTGAAMSRRWRESMLEPRALKAAASRAANPSANPAAGPSGALIAPTEPVRQGDAEAGMRLLSGQAAFGGASALIGEIPDLWTIAPPSPEWRAAAHRFDWLADLGAVGDGLAAAAAVSGAAAWIERHQSSYDPVVWALETAAIRLTHWLGHSRLFASAPEAVQTTLGAAIRGHAVWLAQKADSAIIGLPQLRVAAAAYLASAAMGDGPEALALAAARFDAAVVAGVKGDGGVAGRRPDDVAALLEIALALRDTAAALSVSPPGTVAKLIDQLARSLRFFRLGDGGAPLFHGGRAIDDGRIDLLAAAAPIDGAAPKTMPDSGYVRMDGGRVTAIMDVGRCAGDGHGETAHASCLGFELASGRRRLVVNCGSGASLGEGWRRAGRSAHAHSTLIVDGVSCAGPALAGRWRAFGEDPVFIGPPETHAERKEERNGVWILGAHDAYFQNYGLTLTRRMFLSADGGDFRGEDNLEALDEGARIFERRLGAARGRPIPFTAVFHLHPEVAPELVADGEAVTLRLAHGEVWVMRQAGGRLSLAESVYLPKDAAPRRTRRILVTGAASKQSTQLRWAFRRVGEVSQLPQDVDALLAPVDGTVIDALEGPAMDPDALTDLSGPRKHPVQGWVRPARAT